MFVEALCSINSGQADKGDVLDVSKDVGDAMIRNGSGREVSGDGNSASKKLDSPREAVETTVVKREGKKKAKAGNTGKKKAKEEEE